MFFFPSYKSNHYNMDSDDLENMRCTNQFNVAKELTSHGNYKPTLMNTSTISTTENEDEKI